MANVSGREKVWVNHHDKGDFDTYALSIGSKKQDGTWLNYSQECRFTRGIEPPQNGDYIEYKGFVTLRQWNDASGKSRVSEVWQITEYKVLDRTEKTDTGETGASEGYYTALQDDDVPF